MKQPYDYIVVGGGIIGLSTALHLGRAHPRARILLLEKEAEAGRHQTGRNSGVIHSGIYYRPGSLKARFATQGAEAMSRFCEQEGIPHEICGKLIVATRPEQLGQLQALHERGLANGVPVEKIGPERAREIEPHVRSVAALWVKSTGITSYRAVCQALLRRIEEQGGEVRYGQRVCGVEETATGLRVRCPEEDFAARFLINCAGLYSDRLARTSGVRSDMRIVPFRGEYFELAEHCRQLVRGLIYPVPNPDFPFLGVHFTRMIDGSVHAGPNAVLAFAREGYSKHRVVAGDLAQTLGYPGFWKLAGRHYREGLAEIWRSLSKRAFTRSLQELIPEVKEEDLRPCASGVRAQALRRDGQLVDDFLLVPGRNQLHVCNAPSPAATASLQIGEEIVRQVPPPGARTVPLTRPDHATPHSA